MDEGDVGPAGTNGTAPDGELNSEIRAHKEDLDSLKTKDPEFYKYLQQTDRKLLDFEDEQSDSESGGDEEDGKSDEDDEETPQGSQKKGKVVLIDGNVAQRWCNEAQSNASVKSMRNLVKAYGVGCHYGDDETATSSISFKISNDTVFDKLLMFVLKNADTLFRRVLGVESKKRSALEAAMKSPRWKRVGPLIKSYYGNTLHLLGQTTETGLTAYILQRLRASVDIFVTFTLLNKKFLKKSLSLFGTGLGEIDADKTVRIQSVLAIRALALALPQTHVDGCLKGVYRTYQSCSRFMNSANRQSIRFMQDCVSEVFGVNADAAYKQAFLCIRELAMLLRKALNVKTKDAYLQVYNWQTINSLDLWEHVLSKHGSHEKAALYPLVYPLAQILLGTAQLVSTTKYLPLKFHVLKTLNRLAKNTGVFIPTAALALEGLHFSELSKKPSGVGNSYHLVGLLKVSKQALKTTSFQEQCVNEVILILSEHLGQWAYHISFPELAFPTVLGLKKFVKASSVDKFKRRIRQLVEAIERNADFVLAARQKVNFAPKDTEKVSAFTAELKAAQLSPLLKYAASVQSKAEERGATATTEEVLIREQSPVDEPNVLMQHLADPKKGRMDVEMDVETPSGGAPIGEQELAAEEDIVEDLEVSSEEEGGEPADDDDDDEMDEDDESDDDDDDDDDDSE